MKYMTLEMAERFGPGSFTPYVSKLKTYYLQLNLSNEPPSDLNIYALASPFALNQQAKIKIPVDTLIAFRYCTH